MSSRIRVLFAAALVLGLPGLAHAGTTLFTPPVAGASGNRVACSALNVGRKTLPEVFVQIVGPGGFSKTCTNLLSATRDDSGALGALCTLTATGGDPGDQYWCRIDAVGGSRRSVLGRITVQDADGQTIHAAEAR